jgi:hypothetical protein
MIYDMDWSCAGHYAARQFLAVWKCLTGLVPDEPDGLSFPDVLFPTDAGGRCEIG